MKNKILLIFSLLLIIPLTVWADDANVASLNTYVEGNIILFSGTTVNNSHAVMCKLYDGDEEIDKLSVEVTNLESSGSFSGAFTAPKTGNYTVACANYEGGTIETEEVTVEEMTQLTVTFNTNGGSEIAPVNVNAGEVVTRPQDPIKDDKVFAGWYEDETLTTPFDFSTRITAYITLYAKWTDAPEPQETIQLQTIFYGEGGTYQVDFAADDSINTEPLGEPVNSSHRYFVSVGEEVILTAIPQEGYHFVGWYNTHEENNHFVLDGLVSNSTTYRFTPEGEYVNLQVVFEEDNNEPEEFTVTFNTNGGSEIAPVNITSGDLVERPQDPSNGDKIFAGWYQDETLTTEFDFNTPITTNTTIYAKWTDPVEEFTVIFNTNGGSTIDAVEVEEGSKVSKPANPTKNGKIFAGWYEDEEFNTEYDFNNPVTHNITIYAKWNEKYNLDDGENEVAFTDEENRDLRLIITDMSTPTDELLAEIGMDLETYESVLDLIKNASKKYGTFISLLDISVLDENDNPIEVSDLNIKLKLLDAMKGFKSYKLAYVDMDNNGNINLDETHSLTLEEEQLTGSLDHLSTYVLIGSNEEETTTTNTATGTATNTNSPKTLDNILIWVTLLGISIVGLLTITISNKKIKNRR